MEEEVLKYHVLEFEETFSDLLKSLQYATQCDGISWNVRPSKFSSSLQAPVPHFHNLQCLGFSNIGTWRMEMYVGSFSECTTWFPLNSHDLPLQKVFPLPDQDNRRPQEKVGSKEVERRRRTKTRSRVILAESLWTD